MNQINWKVRLHSGPFWAGMASLILTLVYTLLNMTGVIPKFSYQQVLDVILMVLQIPAFLGVISDPTTKGLTDSRQAMNYDVPKEDV